MLDLLQKVIYNPIFDSTKARNTVVISASRFFDNEKM